MILCALKTTDVLPKLSFSFLLVFTSMTISLAQSNMTVISAEQAAAEVNAQQASYGFGQIYFSNNDLNRLTSVEGASSVRFYTSFSPGSYSQGIIAVPVYSDGSEGMPYLQSDGLNTSEINRESAQAYVQSSKDGNYSALAITVDNVDLTGSIMNPGATGIHIKPGLSGSTNTMIATAANSNGSYSQDLGTDNFRNEAPCPNNCGDGFLINLND
jgi:hypothetical protein